MKWIKGSSKGGQSVPDSVDGAQGHKEILDKFRQVYSELYNSAESTDAMTEIKRKLQGLIGHDSVTEVNKVTGDVLKEACCRMKPGKMDVSGSYTSDVFLNAPDSLFEKIAPVFRSFMVTSLNSYSAVRFYLYSREAWKILENPTPIVRLLAHPRCSSYLTMWC